MWQKLVKGQGEKMPKKIPIVEKREWLQDYEQGKSEAAIASDSRHDLRAIKKGIGEARRERVVNLARADLVKEAIHNHNDKLLRIIQEILSTLNSPVSTQQVPWKRQTSTASFPIEGGKAEYEYGEKPKMFTITLNVESKTDWRFFEEHVKYEGLWKLLNQWKKMLASHLEARMVLKRSLGKLLENDVKGLEASELAKGRRYVLADKPVAGAFIYSHSVDFLFQMATQRLLGLADTSDFEDSIIADSNSGDVRCGGTILAHAPGAEQEYKEHLISAIGNLMQKHEEVNSVSKTYKTVEKSVVKARQTAEEISSMGLVPGQCKICRRLGM